MLPNEVIGLSRFDRLKIRDSSYGITTNMCCRTCQHFHPVLRSIRPNETIGNCYAIELRGGDIRKEVTSAHSCDFYVKREHD